MYRIECKGGGAVEAHTYLAGLSEHQVFNFVTALYTAEAISMVGLFACKREERTVRTRRCSRIP